MKIYNYNKETKEFTTSANATENPLVKGKYLVPASATIEEPLIIKDGFAICFDEEKQEWEYQEDNRGVVVYNDTLKETGTIDYLGIIKDDWIKCELNENGQPYIKYLPDGKPDLVEIEKIELAELIAEKVLDAKDFLNKTDFKMTVDYFATMTTEEQLALTNERASARAYVVANEVK